ncbi:TPR domain-containing protein [Metarhizium album ARSEF 1941]|uniref:TPR domain-containing protein n=1 Tax=Metarhizium album (strain ARSEF 1941) TaxID=1081103 RepID=A0A0B2WQQ6_METAS|nr:TPR domain-containing protein [Metarhizium album ARSEF 1941]KHN95822.1 TPR domain-containing protein [Metarhizium album ARSEF 1941]
MAGNTLFMTPEESARVQETVRNLRRKCQEQMGQRREPQDATSLIQQATGSSLMEDMASSLFGVPQQRNSPETMPAYAVGSPYLPCTTALSELHPMGLSDLRMETHHRGRVLRARRASPVVALKASSWAVVQGESVGDAERLEVFLHKSKHGQELLDLGSVFLVKEPYYTLDSRGEPVIRVDHPSDLVISAYSHGPESWRSTERDVTCATRTAAACKEEGNAALGKKDFARAHACYTEGLSRLGKDDEATDTLCNDLHRNRSHINLLLRRFEEARSDALASLTHSDDQDKKLLDAKAYYRAGTAAYSLGDFEDAKAFFETQLKLEPDNRLAKINLRRIKTRIGERATGAHDFGKIVGSLPKTQGRADAASFDGDTEVKDSPGAGRGLFARRDFEPGEMVMCEKAFCVVWGHEPGAFSALTCDVRDEAAIRVFPAGLHKAVMQAMLNNPSQADRVLDLFSDHQGLGNRHAEQDGGPVIDAFQVHDIVQRNAFGPGRQTEDEDVTNASTGLWVRAAYMNHSCVPNAKKDFVGDLVLLRATRRIAAGEEITHSYDESSDYDARTAAIQKTWGFKCHCELCGAEEADGPDLRRRRLELEDQANSFLQRENPSGASRMAINKAKRLQQSLNYTYNDKRYQGLPRRALSGLEQWLKTALAG